MFVSTAGGLSLTHTHTPTYLSKNVISYVIMEAIMRLNDYEARGSERENPPLPPRTSGREADDKHISINAVIFSLFHSKRINLLQEGTEP